MVEKYTIKDLIRTNKEKVKVNKNIFIDSKITVHYGSNSIYFNPSLIPISFEDSEILLDEVINIDNFSEVMLKIKGE